MSSVSMTDVSGRELVTFLLALSLLVLSSLSSESQSDIESSVSLASLSHSMMRFEKFGRDMLSWNDTCFFLTVCSEVFR